MHQYCIKVSDIYVIVQTQNAKKLPDTNITDFSVVLAHF